jgi:hypothetical protein
MQPKYKALELIDKFTMNNTRDGERNGIRCALIAVDEILKEVVLSTMYWQEVKQEIEKL